MTTDATTVTRREQMPVRRRADLGIIAAVGTAAAFGTSGPFAKALLVTGWSSGAIVLLRVGIAALLLAVPAALACRGRWHLLRTKLPVILVFGLVAVAGCQVAYFNAVSTLSVGVALLLEYSGTVLVVLWVWLRTRRAPSRRTLLGGATALVGLGFVLDIAGQSPPDLIGVMWGLLAAVGLATYFAASTHGDGDLPPVALAGFGMGVGALTLAGLGAVGVLPMRFQTADVAVAGQTLPWLVAIGELAVVAAALAYLLGTFAARALGATVASFVGLSEVLFAIVFAWLLLGELPSLVQLAGGALVVAGVVAVRLGERNSNRYGEPSSMESEPPVSR
jgi:drug/metabolite transporter (DMT)-like permease